MADQTGALAVIGAITGPLGFVLSLLLFFRDRARVQVSVSWDMITIPRDPSYPERFVSVSVVNIGRRPVFVSGIHSRIVGKAHHGLLTGSVEGKTLTEGAPAYSAIADEKYFEGEDWWKIRFAVTGAGGRTYFSAWPTTAPKWAEGRPAPPVALLRNRVRNRLRRFFAFFL